MAFFRRRELPLAILSLMIAISMIDFFQYDPSIRKVASTLQGWVVILAAFALGIGAINMILIHGNNVRKRRPGRWLQSGIMLFFMFIMLMFGIVDLNFQNPVFAFLRNYGMTPMSAALWGLPGFFLITALYRSFRVKNSESTILLVVAIITLLKNAPIGEIIVGSNIVSIQDWLLSVPNFAGGMAIWITFAVATIIIALRTLLGMERGFLGGEKGG
jgi:hypothetical protein